MRLKAELWDTVLSLFGVQWVMLRACEGFVSLLAREIRLSSELRDLESYPSLPNVVLMEGV
jgi:hypothetical protein